MKPLDDTLKIVPPLPRQLPPAGKAVASDETDDNGSSNHGNGNGSSILETDLDFQQTVRMPGAGTLTFGRYRLQRVLGRGGMGVVWLAVDTKLERAVALKFLPDAVGIDPVALKELKEETRRGLDLAHPNIVRIYDFVDDDEGAAAISMEFVDGKSLSERRIALPHHIFTAEQLGPWVGQMCEALDYAHLQKRIVHRDLKPANLMVNSESQIKITDFGISCSLSDTMSRLSRLQQHTGTSGTLLYMSPQQAMGDKPQPTDDIYAVGATLFELLTGKPPFYRGDITTQITGKIAPKLKARREELEIHSPDEIPGEWEDAIAACLDKDPARRPQTAGELAQMLGVSIRSEVTKITPQVKTNSGLRPIEVQSPPTEAKDKAPDPPVVRRLLVACVLILLLAGAGASGIWWWSNRPGEWAVRTEPSGATVTLGGHQVKAPAVIGPLSPGRYEATIAKDGYETRTVAFKVAPGAHVDIGSLDLIRSTGSLTVSSDPDGVEFVVKSTTGETQRTEEGVTPKVLRLPVGVYEVTMEHAGEKKTGEVEVIRDADMPKSFKFDPPTPPALAPAPVLAANNNLPSAPPMPSSADTPPVESSANPSPGTAGSVAPTPTTPSVPPQAAPPTAADALPSSPNTGAMASAGPAGGAPSAAAPSTPPAPQAANPTDQPGSAAPTPGTPGANTPATAGTQPVVGEPPDGHWKLDEIFSSSTYAGYSERGRRYLLYKAQRELDIGADGKVGPGTHKAIQKFQTANALQPTGQLDGPTIAALELANQPDKSDWSPPRSSGGGGRSRSSDRTPESEKTAARKFIERNILGGRDLKDVFKGSR